MIAPLVVVIPFKGGAAAKSRLAAMLPDADRLALAQALLRRAVAVAGAMPGVETVLVVTACLNGGAAAREGGAALLRDPHGAGTAAACRHAQAAVGRGADLLFVNADLPFVTAAALVRLATAPAGVAIAPDRWRTGTNALLLRVGSAVEPCFGARSFARHRAAAEAAGEAAAIVDDPAIAFDVDVPADLLALGEWGGRRWAREWEQAC